MNALVRWSRAKDARRECLGLLVQHIRFELMSSDSLRQLECWAQSRGSAGLDVEQQVRRARKRQRQHEEHGSDPSSKRSCYKGWWSSVGASSGGGTLVAGGKGRGSSLCQLADPSDIAVKDKAVYIADAGNKRVVRWSPGDQEGQVVAGTGADLTGANQMSAPVSIAIDSEGRLYVADADRDRLICVQQGHAATFGSIIENPMAVRVSESSGGVWVLDRSGARIIKLTGEAGETFVVLYSGEVLEDFAVSADGCIYATRELTERGEYEVVAISGKQPVCIFRKPKTTFCGISVSPEGSIYLGAEDNTMAYVLKLSTSDNGATHASQVVAGHTKGSGTHQFGMRHKAPVLDRSGLLFVLDEENLRVMCWGQGVALELDGQG
eukprot:TRINITY_DN34207_c0_g1_i1.p1 TRINITY_DN34207_c0_g1~~TRINITY_DN34207_c0_g1_i1.p1  ORF type:complete len:380 (-),score=50.37 TRINITY_DN34207_c0_g1_i1:139-1278(-)